MVTDADLTAAVARFNASLAVWITQGVGSMWAAYAFAVLALFGLPGAIGQGVVGVVQWIAQTFLQLVLLSVIMVGQNVSQRAADARADATYRDAEAILAELAAVSAALVELRRIAAAPRRAGLVELRPRGEG